MSRQRFQARAKRVQKMGRDGLVEQNLATGEEKRVSQRLADVSFDHERSQEQAAGHRAAQRLKGDTGKKRRKQPRPVQQTAQETAWASTPEPIEDSGPTAAPSMRAAADAPMLTTPDGGVEPFVEPLSQPEKRKRSRKRARRNARKKKQAQSRAQDAARPIETEPAHLRTVGDKPVEKRPLGTESRQTSRLVTDGERLKFETSPSASEGVGKTGKASHASHQRQARRSMPNAVEPAAVSPDEHGGNPHYAAAEDIPDVTTPTPQVEQARSTPSSSKVFKDQRRSHAGVGTAVPVESRAEQQPSRAEKQASAGHPLEGSRLRFETKELAKPPHQTPVERRQMVTHTVQAGNAVPTEETRLRFETEEPAQPSDRADEPQTADAAHMEDVGRQERPHLRFEPEEPAPLITAQMAKKKRQAMYAAANPDGARQRFGLGKPAPPLDQTEKKERQAADTTYTDANVSLDSQSEPEAPAPSPDQAVVEGREAQGADGTAPPERTRLRFEDKPAVEVGAATPSAKVNAAPPSKDDVPPKQRRGYEKAVRRVEKAEQRVEDARENLPKTRRLSFRKETDSDTGKTRRRLHFEEEIKPEYAPPTLPERAGQTVKMAAAAKLHGKIHESERDNVAVEAAHKSELVAERGAGALLRWNSRRQRSKPYRALRRAEQQAAKENVNLAWQTALRDNPELQRKNALAKWARKQQIKRKYAQAAHEAKETAHFTQNVAQATGQIARAAAQFAAAHKTVFLAAAMLALVVILFSAGLTSCAAMLSGFQSSFVSASYMADEQDISNADLYYTELETDLQIDIDKTEENYPGYAGYRYNIGEISHSPYELMAYLSAKFGSFSFGDVKAEIERLFGEQYQLTREVLNGNILQTTLTVRPMSRVIADSLAPGEETDRYNVYAQTLGNRQAFGNPFDFPWLGYVSSDYGYRVHPITGVKNLHRGVDIAVAQGTPIKAVQDGRVVSAGDAGGYGLCVVIEDDSGYQSRYAHCSSISVSAGQEVRRGDVIAAVGSTGQSTGPHLHLEVMLNGEYLNPYYFVDTGGGGTGGAIPGAPGGAVIPDYPGEPPTDETFAAMLAEAEKYLGYPYVWGGSSPSTSFDCSGFVSWVINHSGWNVGRLGAQGLYDICTPVSMENAKPGDLIFFWHTYSAPNPNGVTHVGIYVGNGQMIHCGNPISYANINSSYWQQHYYGMGRLP